MHAKENIEKLFPTDADMELVTQVIRERTDLVRVQTSALLSSSTPAPE